MVRPVFCASISPASCSTAKWADMVGFDTTKWSDSSPADIGRSRSSCSTRRRVGSESALNTLFTFLYLAKHRSIVKRRVRGAMVTPLAEACDKLSAWGWHLLRGAPLRTKRYSERHSL